MGEWLDTAIILRVGHFGESHVWLRALFQHHGLLTVFAFGGAISRKRFCGCLDLLNILHCRVKNGRTGEYNVLQEASLLDSPHRLRKDWQSLGVVRNCLLFLDFMGVTADSSPECYELILDLRATLERRSVSSFFLPLFFRLRIGAALGYSPNFQICGQCNKLLKEGLFLADEGRTYCDNCSRMKSFSHKKHGFYLDPVSLSLLQSGSQLLVSQLNLSDISMDVLRRCGCAIDGFVEYHLGIIWENGSFRRI